MGRKQIFLVYDCDEWKSKDSMRLAMATTSSRGLRSFIASKIERGDFDYGDPDEPRKKQTSEFRREFDSMPRDWLDSKIKFGFYDYTYDGEEL